MAHATGVLQWRYTHSLGRPGWEDEVELHFSCYPTKGIEFFLGMDDGPAESFWVRVKEQSSIGDIVTGACYRLPIRRTSE